MAALADAVSEEARSNALADRSHDLLHEYAKRIGGTAAGSDGASLRGNTSFVGRLAEVAGQADQALKDASDQADWQLQTLAAADTRKSRLEERMAAAQREARAIRETREQASAASSPSSSKGGATGAGGMARKLQSNPQTQPRDVGEL